jgi:hypothetical protein
MSRRDDAAGRAPARWPARWSALVAVVLAGAVACSGGDAGTSSGTPSASASAASTSTPAPTPPATALAALAALAAKGVAAELTATYALDSTDPKQPDATVTIYRRGSSYRVDLVRGAARSLLLTAREGLVSCQVEGARRTCLLVAGPGKPPPKLFDPGLQRLFMTDLQAFVRGSGLTVTEAGTLPAAGALPAARCFTVDGPGVDPGEYCLSDEGVLRRAQFPSGRLELTRLAGPPAPTVFVPPARPTLLPR